MPRLKRVEVRINGHRTAIQLETPFWRYLDEIVAARGTTRTKLVNEVLAADPDKTNMCSTLRTFALAHAERRANGWRLDQEIAAS